MSAAETPAEAALSLASERVQRAQARVADLRQALVLLADLEELEASTHLDTEDDDAIRVARAGLAVLPVQARLKVAILALPALEMAEYEAQQALRAEEDAS